MTLLMDLIYAVLLAVGWPVLIYRRFTRGPSNASLAELMGRVPSRPVGGRCIWIHGVSLGEINATRTIVAELKRRSPEAVVVVSSTTRTGLDRARALYPGLVVFRFPMDFSIAIRTALERIRPSVIVLMELEVWPNLVEIATRLGVPVMIANGRVTEDRSMRRFRWPIVRGLARRMFRKIVFVGAQEDAYARRFVELGVPAERVVVLGSVKYDGAEIADRVEGQQELADAMGISRTAPLLVAGSTGPGEEAILLDAYARLLDDFGDLQLAIVPRKPERFDDVADLIVSRGYVCLRRSTGKPVFPRAEGEGARGDGASDATGATRHVYLGDTMGELRKFYGLADLVFVGRSLVPMGGSDVMEVAGLARPILTGPHTDNFREAIEILAAAGACRTVHDAADLAAAAAELLRDPALRQRMGDAGRAAVVSKQGATAGTVERILDCIP